MIVNPQVFNYRFTIGTLIVAFSGLAIFSFTSYNDAKFKENFLEQEKKLLENQISNVISSYDKLKELSQGLESELDQKDQIISLTHDSITQLKADIFLINKYRNELNSVKQEHQIIIKREDSFIDSNKKLKQENTSISQLLEKQNVLISNLEVENKILEKTLEEGTQITANSFEAAAYELKKSGDIIEITKANKAKNIRVAFVIAKNNLVPKEDKNLYIQVIGPDNNVVADKGAVNFKESSLIYSSKINVFYNNENLEVCTDIKTKETLKPGKYYVSVFDNNRRLGGTQIDLY